MNFQSAFWQAYGSKSGITLISCKHK